MLEKPITSETTASPMLAAIRACITAGRAQVAALQELSDLFHGGPSPFRHMSIEEITVACLRERADKEPDACKRDALLGAARIVEGKK